MTVKKWIRPALFILVGVLVGYGYYRFVGCPTGVCAISSNPVSAMIYMGAIGLLLSQIFTKECSGKCNM